MNIRRITSLTAALSFIIMTLTSIILYIVPQGRIAYWADWHLWGLTKEQWGSIHINTGILFLIALGFHIYYNWKPIVNYLKDKTKQLKVFTLEFNIALILTLVFVLGTYFEIPPLSSILGVSETIKDNAARKYGEPPYGHAELSSLKIFTQKTGINLQEAMDRLKAKGIQFKDENQTLSEISRQNSLSPRQVYQAMKPEGKTPVVPVGTIAELPDSPAPGTGNMTLASLCSQYNLNMKTLIRALREKGIQAKDDLTLKKIAEQNRTGPLDIYEHIRTIAHELAETKGTTK